MYLYILIRIAGQSKMLNKEPQAKARIERNKKKINIYSTKKFQDLYEQGDHANDSTAININMEKKRKKRGLENLHIYSFLRKEII